MHICFRNMFDHCPITHNHPAIFIEMLKELTMEGSAPCEQYVFRVTCCGFFLAESRNLSQYGVSTISG